MLKALQRTTCHDYQSFKAYSQGHHRPTGILELWMLLIGTAALAIALAIELYMWTYQLHHKCPDVMRVLSA